MVKIQKQQAMRNVIIGLIPLILAAIYFYGWRFLALYVVVGATGLLSEWLMAKKYNYKVTESLFVSCTLFALSLPPTIPLWIGSVGIAFGIIFGKMVFGGFGKKYIQPRNHSSSICLYQFWSSSYCPFYRPSNYIVLIPCRIRSMVKWCR